MSLLQEVDKLSIQARVELTNLYGDLDDALKSRAAWASACALIGLMIGYVIGRVW